MLILFSSCRKEETSTLIQEISNWEFLFENEWYKADVPGNTFSDLLNHNFIADPFYGTNEDSVQWVANENWHYQSVFSADQITLKRQKQVLIFNGLDTYAKVYLNDSLILVADNMFREWKVDVKGILQKNNLLEIQFESVSGIEKQKQNVLGYSLPGGSRVFTRKAGFHYGWDWGAKISPTGIWRKVELQSWNDCKINNVYVIKDHLTDSVANLTIGIEIESSTEKIINISTYSKVCEDFKLKEGNNKFSVLIKIPNPELWWPNGYGEQKLYDISVYISDENGMIDVQTKKIGLRKIELITERDSVGESFNFRVNNKLIFMKGANYIPQDNLQNRVTEKHYRDLLQDVVDANMNMLRVWGGGIYEEDIFYDLCDSLGILVWQDFMFACAMYPSDSLFLENVKMEAIQNVKRLGHHPSIALWCGNNENSEGWHRWGWQNDFSESQKAKIWDGYKKIFQKILPQTVDLYSQTSYWESSPKFGRGNPQHQFEGDAHYWGVWHDAEPFENLEKKVPRFMSEFGFQSFPQLSTIAAFSDSSEWNLNSAVMQNHQKHPRGNALISEYMAREYYVQKDFEKFIYASQILQANGMRIGLESHRRNQPYCMGTLYWQLNDCWPVASWSSRDYFGNWKALHYTIQDVFAHISLSLIIRNNGEVRTWVTSDLEKEIEDTLLVEIWNLKGEKIEEISNAVSIKKDATNLLFLKNLNLKTDEFVIAKLKKNNVISKTIFAEKVKNSIFKKPVITFSWNDDMLTVKSDIPAFEVYLHGLYGHFNDNFFTLFPNQEKTIKFEGSLKDRKKLLIWSLYDLNN